MWSTLSTALTSSHEVALTTLAALHAENVFYAYKFFISYSYVEQ